MCSSALPPDEIMHQDITPLCAADIQDQLKKRFAYLSGECRRRGSVGQVLHGEWLASPRLWFSMT